MEINLKNVSISSRVLRRFVKEQRLTARGAGRCEQHAKDINSSESSIHKTTTYNKKETNDHGDKTFAGTSTTSSPGLRTATRTSSAAGARLVLQEVLGGEL